MQKLYVAALNQHERNKNTLISLQKEGSELTKVVEADEKNLLSVSEQTQYMSRKEIDTHQRNITHEMTGHKAAKDLVEMKKKMTEFVVASSDSNLREAERCLNMVCMAKLPWS